MKKTNPTKLAVRRETLRALAGLELIRAAGGDAILLYESGKAICPSPALAEPAPR